MTATRPAGGADGALDEGAVFGDAVFEGAVLEGAVAADAPEQDNPDADESTGSASRRRWPDGGLGVLVAGLLAFVAARPLADNSFLTHLATGRLILEQGVPSTNPFLYSARIYPGSAEFPIPSWLWSVVLGGVDAVAGGAGLRVLTAALAGVLGLVVVRLTRPVTGGERTLLSVVLPATCVVITLMPFVNARPQLPGYLFLALTVLVATERRSGWWLVAVFALWANVHGTWFYGLAVLGLLVVAQVLDERRIGTRRLGWLVGAVVGVVLGGLLQPHPFETVILPLEQLGDERARRAIANYVEWKPAGFDHPLTWLLIAMGLVALFAALGLRQGPDGSDGPRRWGVLLGAVGLVAMGMSAGRLLPLAVITLVPWVAMGLQGLRGLPLPSGGIPRVLASLGVLLGVVALVWSTSNPAYDLSRYPVTAIDWLAERGLMGSADVKVASHDYVGNYLDWRYEDRANTFVDDRPGTDALLDYAALQDLTDGWRDALGRAEPDVIVWETERPLTDELREPAWYDAGRFGEFTVFCRSSIADRCR